MADKTEWPDPPAERFTAQAEGKHPAPCARFCEANAFAIEIRGWREAARRLEGERAVLAALLRDAVGVLRTMEPEGQDEGELIAGLIERAEKACAEVQP